MSAIETKCRKKDSTLSSVIPCMDFYVSSTPVFVLGVGQDVRRFRSVKGEVGNEEKWENEGKWGVFFFLRKDITLFDSEYRSRCERDEHRRYPVCVPTVLYLVSPFKPSYDYSPLFKVWPLFDSILPDPSVMVSSDKYSPWNETRPSVCTTQCSARESEPWEVQRVPGSFLDPSCVWLYFYIPGQYPRDPDTTTWSSDVSLSTETIGYKCGGYLSWQSLSTITYITTCV